MGRGARIIAIVALILLGALIALWTQRKPIAAGYVDQYLAQRGVPARYRIAALGFGRQRLTDVVIGDPAHPDLVADWIELGTSIGFGGAAVDKVRVGHMRLRGRLVNGTLSLGALDRLMPPPSGKPFTLPALDVDLADARMRLETPYGLVGLKLSGRGRLNDGFAGTLAAVSDRLDLGGCVADRGAAVVRVAVAAMRPSLTGPVRAAGLACGETFVATPRADLDVALGEALDQWKGAAQLVTGMVRHPIGRTQSIAGQVTFAGNAAATSGSVLLDSGRFMSADASGTRLGIAGRYSIGQRFAFDQGTIDGAGVAIAPARLAAIARLAESSAGTPIGPLADQLARAMRAAGQSLSGTVRLSASSDGPVRISQISLSSASGFNAMLDDAGIAYDPRGGALRVAGALTMRGGGFPALDMMLAQDAPGTPVTGVARLRRPYQGGGAILSLTPLRFSATPGGNTRFSTQATLSGPVGDGRVDALTLPVDGLWDGRGRLAMNTDCTPLSFQRLAVSGLRLRPASLRLCPIGGALLRLDNGRVGGGATIAAPRLSGSLGDTPLTLAAAGSRVTLGDTGFGLDGLAVRIGSEDRVTRLDFGTLTGRLDGGAVKGRFTGGAGQIGKVPLLVSDAAGDWTLVNGRLALKGAMIVADDNPDPRFHPLAARDVALTLIDGRIAATGNLVQPEKGVAVANVVIAHDLSSGTGKADLDVPGITFGDKIQPDDLTRLTVGVIANVEANVSGRGQIRWSPDAVTSDGVFRTAGANLAAAVGPVTGIATEIHFTDLLALESAPGQVATIKSINPGIAVENGRIVYQTLANARVDVAGGRWPLAGGELVLEPTLLDFAEAQERRMTFNVTAMDAGQFLQQFNFANLNATGTFDGRLPMIFDQSGGRIEDGRLTMRAGGGTIAYLGEVTKADVGFWGNLAFQSLKSLRYKNLDVVMNGPLAGEMITEVRFAGVGQGDGAKRNFILDRLQKLPFVFNVRITAPFRQLIDSAQSFYDPKRLVERNLPALIEEQNKRANPPAPPPVIQPQESRTVP